mmetsp:Transcript_2393/g.3515  ORF Transcript_2393/g.3515 Transcript_2393/m.3515 type:complete len:203 (-) Transcript_2393:242-850(-)
MLSLKERVFFLLDNEVDITWLNIRLFIGHAMKCDPLVVPHTLVDVYFQNFALLFCFCDVSLSTTYMTRALDLLNHTRTNLSDFHDSTLSFALGTNRWFTDHDLPVDGKLDCLPIVEVGERDFERMAHGLAFSWTCVSSSLSSKEHGKQILPASSWTRTIVRDSLQSVFVICRTLFWVTQNFVCSIDLLEFLLVSTFIWMVGS